MICVFDCETIPDCDLIRSVKGFEGSDAEVIEQASREQVEKSGTTFLPLPYHKIVAISAVIGDDFGRFLKVGDFGKSCESEEEILLAFTAYLNGKNPRLVSFNGRSFDIPLILLRSLKYNIEISAYFEKDNGALNKTKWDNYRQRYSEEFHTDLLDSLGNFGAARGLRLDEVCKMANIPGKYEVSGDDVLELYKNGDFTRISEYCQSDCLNTYWLFLKYELLKGTLAKKDYQDILKEFLTRLPQEKSYTAVFAEALMNEIGRVDE